MDERDFQPSQIPKMYWQSHGEAACTIEHENDSQNKPGSPDVLHRSREAFNMEMH